MTKIRLETPTVLANGILQTDNPIDGTLQTVKDQNGNSSELQIANNDTKVTGTLTVADTLTAEERINLEADSTATTQTTAVIQATDTDSGIAIVPNGTGAFTLDVPDGTATGGNARGSYAVDLQRVRSSANQVASGQYSFVVGNGNTASGISAVAFGYNNVASNYTSFAVGSNNTASGQRSVALGRSFQQATGDGSFSMGYYQNIASGLGSVALGGSYNVAVAGSSFAKGSSAKAYLTNQEVRGGGFFEPIKASDGHVQFSYLTSRKEDTLTTGATTILSLDGTGTTNLIIPDGNNRVWNVTIKYTAVVRSITGTATGVSVGDCKNEVLTIGFKKIGGTSSVVGSLNTLSTNEDLSMSTASFGVSAGASQEMKLDFTAPTFLGGGSITTRVVAKVELTECAY